MLIQFTLQGEKQLIRKFRGIKMAGKNWLPTMRLIGRDLTGLFSGAVFTTEGREIGEPWQKRKVPKPWPLLDRTGKLKEGFKYDAKRLSVTIYNIADYFVYHQSNQPRRRLPRRVMMKIDNKRKANIMRRFQQTIVKKLWQT